MNTTAAPALRSNHLDQKPLGNKLQNIFGKSKEASFKNISNKTNFTLMTPQAFLPLLIHHEIRQIVINMQKKEYKNILLDCVVLAEKENCSLSTLLVESAEIMKWEAQHSGNNILTQGMKESEILKTVYYYIFEYFVENKKIDHQTEKLILGHIYCNFMFLDHYSRIGFTKE